MSDYADEPAAVAKAHVGLSAVARNRRDWDTARSELEAVLKIEEVSAMPVTAEARWMIEQLPALVEPVVFVSRPPVTPLESLEQSYPFDVPGVDDPYSVPDPFDYPGQ